MIYFGRTAGLIGTIMVIILNTSYCQTLFGVEKGDYFFYEELKSGEKRKLLRNGKERILDSIRNLSKAANFQNSAILSSTTDTLYCKVYSFNAKKLIVKYCGMALFDENEFLWGYDYKNCISSADDCTHVGNSIVYFTPVFSRGFRFVVYVDNNSPMFVNRSSVVEIDLNTGHKHVIKKKCRNPSYSPDSNYILLEESGREGTFYVYDRTLRKVIAKYKNVEVIYWVE